MDGLSLFLLLFFFKVAGAFFAIVSSAILVNVANSRIAVLVNAADSRILVSAKMQGAFLWGCVCAPFMGLLWVWVSFAGYSYVNKTIFHQDDVFTVDPYVTLPDGYVVGKPVDYCWGYIAAPGVRTPAFDKCHSPAGSGYVTLVGAVQVSSNYIAGAGDTHGLGNAPPLPNYFLLDRKTGNVQRFSTEDALRAAAASKGIDLSLDYIGLVYERYRVHWIDWLLVPAQLFGLAGLLAFLLFWSKRLLRPYSKIES